jgi:hypothetical protein
MENNELQAIWKTLNIAGQQRSKEELQLLLRSKARHTMNRFVTETLISILISAGLFVYLIITSINRADDMYYLTINIILLVITLISLVSGYLSWKTLRGSPSDQPLKVWLEQRTNVLTKWLYGRYCKLYLYLIPPLFILILLSIHVYFEFKPFLEVLNNAESVTGLLVALPIGLFVSFFTAGRIRRLRKQQLEFLLDLQTRLLGI